MAKHHGKHMMHEGKHLQSPPADLPHPHARPIDGHHGSDRKLASPADHSAGLEHHNPTPDMGHRAHKLFGHKPNDRGV